MYQRGDESGTADWSNFHVSVNFMHKLFEETDSFGAALSVEVSLLEQSKIVLSQYQLRFT
jgi:hypothetical protein